MKRAFFTFLAATILIFSSLASRNFALGADCDQVDKIFSSVYAVTFDIKNDGAASVTQKISLKNLSSDCFVSEFSLKINTDRVIGVSGEDALGPMKVGVTKKSGSANLSAKLNEEVIGLGKSVSFVLKYTLVGLAEKRGTIWNLSVPKITTSEKVTNYSLSIVAPSSFGKIFSATPPPKEKKGTKDFTILNYDQGVLDLQGLSVSFGDAQNILFKFKLPLENKQLFAKTFSVPLPPDTATQRLFIRSIQPPPKKIYMDEYGNYWADYLVPGRKFIEVKIEGSVKLVNQEGGFTLSESSEKKLDRYKRDSAFVQSQDSLIQTKAKELADPYEIYRFVIDSLVYDFEKAKIKSADRLGASSLINKNQKATALDYVDLFTALSRASGVPTREIFGLAISENSSSRPIFTGSPLNSDIFHTWAQFYDKSKKSWVDVDPVWGDTSELNFFGNNVSEKIALLFTDSDAAVENLKVLTTPGSLVETNFTENKENFDPEATVKVTADQAVAGFPAQLKIKIINKKGTSLLGVKLLVETFGVTLIGEKEISLDPIMPFAEKDIRYTLKGGGFFGDTKGSVRAILTTNDGQKKAKFEGSSEVVVASFFSFGTQQLLLLMIAALLILGNFAPTYFKKRK